MYLCIALLLFVLSYIPPVYPLARSKIMYFYANNYLFLTILNAPHLFCEICVPFTASIFAYYALFDLL